MTINGISTCTEAGTEKYERFQLGIGRRKRTLVQYDYRHTDIFIQVFFIKLYAVQPILIYFNNLQDYSTFKLIEFMQE